jgi:transcriptional regulator with XRE-family HTH domain
MAEPIGSTLKQRREARHLSIAQVAEQTRIRPHYLQALETDDLSAIPSMAQARGFLRNYSEFLGLNLDELSSTARPTESQLPTTAIASPAEPLSAPAPSNSSASDSQLRPGFFDSLRDRFARRPSADAAAPEPQPAVPSASEPEPEVFVPVRTHEELPAAPEESHQTEPIIESEPIAKPARVRKASSKKTSTKKPERTKTKTTKSSKAGAGRDARVKKKITKLP